MARRRRTEMAGCWCRVLKKLQPQMTDMMCAYPAVLSFYVIADTLDRTAGHGAILSSISKTLLHARIKSQQRRRQRAKKETPPGPAGATETKRTFTDDWRNFSDVAANPIIGCRSSEAEQPPETRVVRNHASKSLTWPVKSKGRHV